jgi:hypothetical protein
LNLQTKKTDYRFSLNRADVWKVTLKIVPTDHHRATENKTVPSGSEYCGIRAQTWPIARLESPPEIALDFQMRTRIPQSTEGMQTDSDLQNEYGQKDLP